MITTSKREALSFCLLCNNTLRNRSESSQTSSAADGVKHCLDKMFDWNTLAASSLHFLGLCHSASRFSCPCWGLVQTPVITKPNVPSNVCNFSLFSCSLSHPLSCWRWINVILHSRLQAFLLQYAMIQKSEQKWVLLLTPPRTTILLKVIQLTLIVIY